jgi:hypothetical protein
MWVLFVLHYNSVLVVTVNHCVGEVVIVNCNYTHSSVYIKGPKYITKFEKQKKNGQ